MRPDDPSADAPRVLAFYLPQFHPTPENDAWWGRGFTEWTNVVRGRPLFRGHEQPHLPADLGFYDLRVPQARLAQAELAREAGLEGFVYYHYWFGGRRLLHEPFDAVLESGEPDLPFALCWANENWTRAWDGGEHEILIEQQHSDADDIAHLDHVARAFRDPRYVRVDGKPLYLVYRATLLPDARRTTDLWRERAREIGIGELFLARVQSFGEERTASQPLGFDAAVDWSPNWGRLGQSLRRRRLERWVIRLGLGERAYRSHRVYDYDEVIRRTGGPPNPSDVPLLPCVTPSWDNSVRRQHGGGVIFRGATPTAYGAWLRAALARARRDLPAEQRLVFVNAWNEWAEGNHLEPDQRWGRAWLEATRQAIEDDAAAGAKPVGG
jgi:lipopolysaccharide biosynthesis protein